MPGVRKNNIAEHKLLQKSCQITNYINIYQFFKIHFDATAWASQVAIKPSIL